MPRYFELPKDRLLKAQLAVEIVAEPRRQDRGARARRQL